MQIRKATIEDIDEMQRLIQQFADLGLMLPRTVKSLCEHLQSFTVVVRDGRVVGAVGLHILWTDLAEVRSLAVDPSCHGQGIGRLLVETAIRQAEELRVTQVLSLTYQTDFFDKLGFHVVNKETLPHKIWRDCMYCKKFQHCDEIAMVYTTQAALTHFTTQVAEA